jgi:hypothetical protein
VLRPEGLLHRRKEKWENAMTDAVCTPTSATADAANASEPAAVASDDMALFIKLAATLTGVSEAKLLASSIDPAHIIDAYCKRFISWSEEPLRLADFVA